MNSALRSQLNFSMLFAIGAFLVSGLLFLYVGQSDVFEANANILAPAMAFDMIISIPAIFWFLERKRNVRAITILLLMVVGLNVAWFTIPDSHNRIVEYAAYLLYPVAIVVGVFASIQLIRKATAKFQSSEELDRVNRIKFSVRSIVGENSIADSIAQEATMVYYLFRRKPQPEVAAEVPPSATKFTYHRKSAINAILLIGIVVMTVEITTVHLIVAMWSHLLAWIATATSVYFGGFIIAQVRAVNSRPIYVFEDRLHIRNGMFNLANLPLSEIESVELTGNTDPDLEQPLTFCMPVSHNVLIHLRTPQTATLLYGRKQKFQTALVYVDDPKNLESALTSTTESA